MSFKSLILESVRNNKLGKNNKIEYFDDNGDRQVGKITTTPKDGSAKMTVNGKIEIVYNQFESWWETSLDVKSTDKRVDIVYSKFDKKERQQKELNPFTYS